jgi:tellurite resistance protein
MSLGLLVGRFGALVRENHIPPPRQMPEADFPEALNHLRDSIGYHLIPLVLLARADREFLDSEREVIVSHCLAIASEHGLQAAAPEEALLRQYIGELRPSLVQLDPALHRLAHSGTEEVAALLKAAQAVTEADGQVSPEETRLFADFLEELGALPAGPRTP